MKPGAVPLIFLALFSATLAATLIDPTIDLTVSGWFYDPAQGFYLADNPLLIGLHWFAVKGSWALGIALLACLCISFFKPVAMLAPKAWLFLLLTLLIGPVLIANVGLKDHWGRARPREVTEFGGTAAFTPATMSQPVAHKNGSFISGDGAFGFYLPSFAYVVLPPRRSRRVFWGGMAAGGVFAFDRIAMGGHFLSDNLFAALLMLAASALLHALMFGRKATGDCWRDWLQTPLAK